MDEFCTHRAAPRRRCRGTPHELRRTVPCHGVCAVDLARVLARHRGDVGSERRQALFDEFAPQRSSIHCGRRKRLAGLAHLVRPRGLAHSTSPQVLLRRGLGAGLDQYGLRPGCNDDRSVLESVRLGPVSQHQGSLKMHPVSADHRRFVQEPLAGGVVLQADLAAFADQEISGHEREHREDAKRWRPRAICLVRRLHLRAHRHRQEGASTQCFALHIATDSFRLSLRENPAFMRLAARFPNSRNAARL